MRIEKNFKKKQQCTGRLTFYRFCDLIRNSMIGSDYSKKFNLGRRALINCILHREYQQLFISTCQGKYII